MPTSSDFDRRYRTDVAREDRAIERATITREDRAHDVLARVLYTHEFGLWLCNVIIARHEHDWFDGTAETVIGAINDAKLPLKPIPPSLIRDALLVYRAHTTRSFQQWLDSRPRHVNYTTYIKFLNALGTKPRTSFGASALEREAMRIRR